MSVAIFGENDIEFYRPETVFVKGQSAPHLSLYRHIGADGSPNRILERLDPYEALERVTKQHAMIADWIRAQEWGDRVPRGNWKYIVTTKRMKACRQQLRAMILEMEAERDDE